MKNDAQARGIRTGDAESHALATSLMNHNTSSGEHACIMLDCEGVKLFYVGLWCVLRCVLINTLSTNYSRW